jgi:hypothetical protein
MALPRFLANIVRKDAEPEIVTTRNFDDLGSILEGYAQEIESQSGIIDSIKTFIGKLIPPAILGKGLVWDVRSFGTLQAAITYLGSTTSTLYITSLQTISATTTIPSNISIEVLGGGGFTSSAASSLVINGPFECGNSQCFFGDLVVTFGASSTKNKKLSWFGADESGVTDSTTMIQKFITNGWEIKESVESIFKITSRLTAPANIAIKIKGNLNLRPFTEFTVLQNTAVQSASTTMTGSSRIGALAFTVTSAAGMAIGDIVEIQSNLAWPYDPGAEGLLKGETTKIIGIAGNTITPATALMLPYDTASETVTVKTYTPQVAQIDGLNVLFTTSAGASYGASLSYLDGGTSYIKNVTIKGAAFAGLSIGSSYGLEIINPALIECYYTGAGYGIQFNAVYNCHVKGGSGYRCRHAVDFSGGYPSHVGSVIGMHVVGHPDEGSCVGTHGSSNQISFIGNWFLNGIIAVQSRGSNCIIHDNFYWGQSQDFFNHTGAPGLSVRGNAHFLEAMPPGASLPSVGDAYFGEIGGEDTDLYGFADTRFIIEGNTAHPKTAFLRFGSGISELKYWSIRNNTVVIQNNDGSNLTSFLVSDYATPCQIRDTTIIGDNVVHRIIGTYTEWRNITLASAFVWYTKRNEGDYYFSADLYRIFADTSDGSDTKSFGIGAGGDTNSTRGANILAYGNEHVSTGKLDLSAGDVTGALIRFYTQSLLRYSIDHAGLHLFATALKIQGGLQINGGTYSSTPTVSGDIYSTSTLGLVAVGRSGTASDLLFANSAGNTLFENPRLAASGTSKGLRYYGPQKWARGANVASANDLTLGDDGNSFGITGTTSLNGIKTADWVSGSEVKLFLLGNITVKHNTAPSGGFAKFKLQGAADFVATSGAVLTVEYDGTDWQETARRTA